MLIHSFSYLDFGMKGQNHDPCLCRYFQVCDGARVPLVSGSKYGGIASSFLEKFHSFERTEQLLHLMCIGHECTSAHTVDIYTSLIDHECVNFASAVLLFFWSYRVLGSCVCRADPCLCIRHCHFPGNLDQAISDFLQF